MEKQTYRRFTFYNGTFRSMAVFNLEDCALNEQHEYYLKNLKTAIAPWKLEIMKPLIITEGHHFKVVTKDINFFSPDNCNGCIDYLRRPDITNYDVIVVTKTYTEAVHHQDGIDPDFLDRLFIPVAVHMANPLDPSAEDTRPIGIVGFKKVYMPFTWERYYHNLPRLNSFYRPSKAAISIALHYYHKEDYIYDPDVQPKIAALQEYINGDTYYDCL